MTEGWTEAILTALDGIEGGLQKWNGVAIWINMSGECCKKESCCVIWLGGWTRLNWQKSGSKWHKCSATNRELEGIGFDANDTAGLKGAILACVREATDAFCK